MMVVPPKHAVEPPLRPNECMLRVTIRLDLDNQTEVAFARAALKHLNVRHVKAQPDVLDKQIMQGEEVGKFYWEQRHHNRALANYMVGSDPRLQRPTAVEPIVPVVELGPPGGAAKALEPVVSHNAVTVQNFQPKRTWIRIFERRMPKPKLKWLDSD